MYRETFALTTSHAKASLERGIVVLRSEVSGNNILHVSLSRSYHRQLSVLLPFLLPTKVGLLLKLVREIHVETSRALRSSPSTMAVAATASMKLWGRAGLLRRAHYVRDQYRNYAPFRSGTTGDQTRREALSPWICLAVRL